ncbi:MAG: exo-alpha-sialidase [Planctomycetes bacterium]|nr:exo-alpha-sialidase [Planctomycetota bacterium]
MTATREIGLPGLRVVLGQPQVVTEGVGFCWFGGIWQFPTGPLAVLHERQPDSNDNLLSGSRVILSSDSGRTWDFGYDIVQRGTMVPCADGSLAGPAGGLLPMPGAGYRSFCADYVRFEAGGHRYVREPLAARVEGLPRSVKPHRLEGTLGRQWPAQIYGTIQERVVGREALALCYATFEGDRLYSTVLFTSRDEGRSWQYRSIVAGPEAWPEMPEGPCEGTLVELAHGGLMAVMRIGSGLRHRLIRAYSGDEGRTWSAADPLPAWSVSPCLRRMRNGVLALSTGRPGIHLWLSADERGVAWQSVDILAHHNAVMKPCHAIRRGKGEGWEPDDPAQTTAYTMMVEVSPNHLLLEYDRIPFGWRPVPTDSTERSRLYVLPIEVERI